MEINYKREMNHNYLMLEQEQEEPKFEIRMMLNNTIDGLLKFRLKKVDARCYFCYEITSKQPLSRILETKGLTAQEIRSMVTGIARTLTRMEEYLLKEEQLILNPDFIYVEPEFFTVEFCLIPGREGDFPAELNKLFEYFLGKADHQDQECVVMAYGLYRESLKENYGMEDLLKVLCREGRAQEETEKDGKQSSLEEEEYEKQEQEKGMAAGELPNRELPNRGLPNREISNREKTQRVKKSFYDRIKERLGRVWRKEKETSEQLPWQMVFAGEEDEHEEEDQSFVNIREVKISEYTKEKEPQLRMEPAFDTSNTVLLTSREEKKQLRRLMSLEKDIPDICISYYPFIIGKQENLVDFCFDQDTVSRLHMRIDEENGRYRITDLNSTNGTMAAGRLLENNETAEVAVGDEIVMAGFHFQFC